MLHLFDQASPGTIVRIQLSNEVHGKDSGRLVAEGCHLAHEAAPHVQPPIRAYGCAAVQTGRKAGYALISQVQHLLRLLLPAWPNLPCPISAQPPMPEATHEIMVQHDTKQIRWTSTAHEQFDSTSRRCKLYPASPWLDEDAALV